MSDFSVATAAFPLSLQQSRSWRWRSARWCRSQCAVLLESSAPTARERVQAALPRLLAAHEILRTRFVRPAGLKEPLQTVASSAQPSWVDADWSGEEDWRTRLAALYAQVLDTPWDADAQSLQVWWLRLDGGRAVLLVSASALCLDGAGLSGFMQALLAGAAPDVEQTLQYIDVADELSAALDSAHGREGLAHWSRQRALQWEAGLVSPAQAETGEAPGEVRDSWPLSPTQAQTLSVAPGGARTWLLACWQTLLQRRLRSQDVVVAAAFDGRNDEQLTQVIGPLTRYLPLRTPADAASNPHERLSALAQTLAEAEQWQEYFTWPSLRPEAIWAPAYGFGLAHAPSLPGARWLALSANEDRFEQKLGVFVDGDRLLCSLSYERARHADADMSRLLAQFRALLEASLAQPRSAIAQLPHVDVKERSELLRDKPIAATPWRTAHALFSAHAQAQPDATALHASGGERWSYARLEQASNRLAHYLREQGVGAEDRVAVCLEREPNWIVSLLGVLKAGGVYVPIDPDFHPQRIAHVLADAGCVLVLTDSAHAAALGDYAGRRLLLDAIDDTLAAHTETAPSWNTDVEQLAYLIYTSGSTGTPKGVGISHRALHNYVQGVSERLALPAQAELLSLATIGADLGHTALFVALCTGRTLRLLPAALALDAEGLADELERAPVDCLKIVPTHLQALLSADRPHRVLPRACLVLGGSALEPELVARVRALAPQCRIVNHYGPTETTVGICTHEVAGGERPGVLPIGRALMHSGAYVLNEAAELSGVGMPGELYLGGESVARGYWGRPDLTAERFVPDPYGAPGSRLYRTGDLCVRWADGTTVYQGRLDHQVKIRGYRVELGEIESVLCTHEAVESAVVVLAAGERLCAYVVASAGAAPKAEALRAWLSERLPEYMLPTAWQSLKTLPLTRNGKVDRDALPAIEARSQSRAYRAPGNEVEARLVEVWQLVLGLSRVGVDDDFFELGGNSLLVTRVLTGVKRAIGVAVPLSAFFDGPTIAAMATRIGGLIAASTPQIPLLATTRSGEWTIVSSGQQRLWVTQALEGATATYNTPHVWVLRGALDLAALEAAFAEVLRRHDVLRTVYEQRDGVVWQRALPAAERFAIEPVDLQHLSAADQAIEACPPLLARIREEGAKVFDLATAPPFAVVLLKLAPDRHVLISNVHHIASDGWSLGLLQREVSRYYNAAAELAGSPPVFSPPALQYADYASWQRAMLEAGRLQTQVEYWQRRLAGLVPASLSSQSPAGEPTGSGSFSFQLESELLERMQAFAHARGMTLFMLLVAALNLLIARNSGSPDVAIGTSVAGRNRSEVEELIGFFVNQLVLRTDLSGDPSVEALLAATRETVVGALDHQDLPFSTLVSDLAPSRSASRSPFFQVLFVLQDFPDEPLRLRGLEVSVWVDQQPAAKFDLTLYAGQVDGGLQATWIYDAAVFSTGAVEALSRQMRYLLGQMLERPESALSAIELMSRDEREALEREKQQRKSIKLGKLKAIAAHGEGRSLAKTIGEASQA